MNTFTKSITPVSSLALSLNADELLALKITTLTSAIIRAADIIVALCIAALVAIALSPQTH
jgi:hypothetical protein